MDTCPPSSRQLSAKHYRHAVTGVGILSTANLDHIQQSDSWGLSTLNPDSNRFSNQIAQCESNAHQSRPHCIVRNRIHVCTLTSSSHTSTQLPWRPRQIFTSVFASQVERYMQHSVQPGEAHSLSVFDTQVCMLRPFWSSSATRNPDQSGSKPPLEVEWN